MKMISVGFWGDSFQLAVTIWVSLFKMLTMTGSLKNIFIRLESGWRGSYSMSYASMGI